MAKTIDIDDELFSKYFRANLAQEMQKRGFNASSLSRHAGLNLRAVKDILDGRAQSPRLSTACRLAQALGVPLASLLNPTGSMGTNSLNTSPQSALLLEIEGFLDTLSPEHQERLLESIRLLASICAQK